MKAAIIGYGKMGREIERILRERGHDVPLIIDLDNRSDLSAERLREVDAALEFSTPATAYDNIRACIDAGTPVVSGTTGWTGRLEELRTRCRERNGAFFYASNYSLGVNLLFRLNRQLAEMIGRVGGYDVRIEEIHHTQKKDAPSGTAITLAEEIIDRIGTKQRWVNRPAAAPDELEIDSLREGAVPGTHTVAYTSDDDVITLRHELKSRRALALGAVVAAEFLVGKHGVYTMDDLLK
ncbi:4-hydroxy-tetrahydrodipicolinate reductase [uncultured Alistipes sp.]|uniref:4-hydroxy-tetrahydrodipicolinate reductase n=1 Tax=uncultured Alistipes sp. TaxID=538949 RepID=UPI002632B8F0|nr:4-hydroxy-tetrahydrodipicolinate reductase [uncultured Alistipes sp.]